MHRGAPYLCEQVCKPGSVFDSHLSKRIVAGALQPPRERTGRPIAPIAVLLRIEFTASDTLEPMGELLPRLSTLTSEEAVYLCCTFPEVAFGGRYPLSLPCGARTFLMNRLSPCPRNCLAYSQSLLYRMAPEKSTGDRLLRRGAVKIRGAASGRRPPPSGGDIRDVWRGAIGAADPRGQCGRRRGFGADR